MTGIVNNDLSKLYAIYTNPEHVHILILRSPSMSEKQIAIIITESSEHIINENNLCKFKFS